MSSQKLRPSPWGLQGTVTDSLIQIVAVHFLIYVTTLPVWYFYVFLRRKMMNFNGLRLCCCCCCCFWKVGNVQNILCCEVIQLFYLIIMLDCFEILRRWLWLKEHKSQLMFEILVLFYPEMLIFRTCYLHRGANGIL